MILFIDPHRTAHHDQQIMIAKIERSEFRVRHVDAVDGVTCRLDWLTKARHAFARDVPDDERALHRRVSGCACGGSHAVTAEDGSAVCMLVGMGNSDEHRFDQKLYYNT